MSAADPSRAPLRAQIVDLVRRLGSESQRLAHAFAGRQGLHETDLHALVYVMERENAGSPSTTGELAAELGVTSGAATGVVDRLERDGHLRRDRDLRDRRRVYLRRGEAGTAVAMRFFGPLGVRSDAVMDDFSDTELAVVARFLTRITAEMAAHRAELDGGLD